MPHTVQFFPEAGKTILCLQFYKRTYSIWWIYSLSNTMSDVNKVMLVGDCIRDVEVRGEKQNVAVFSLVTKYTKDDGEEVPTFHNCVAFGKSAQNLANSVRKGSRVSVEGTLSTSKYEDQMGNERTKTEIIVWRFYVVGTREAAPASTPMEGGGESFNNAVIEQGHTSGPNHRLEPAQPTQESIDAAKAKMAARNDDISISDVPF